MEILLTRITRTATTTIGNFLVNGFQICYTLEDKDRGLKQSDPIETIRLTKVYAQTAIPEGRYEVALTYSNRFKKYLPLLLNVPGFEGIRIHPGNYAKDTEGCILLGETKGVDFVGSSKIAFAEFMGLFEPASKREKIFITIT